MRNFGQGQFIGINNFIIIFTYIVYLGEVMWSSVEILSGGYKNLVFSEGQRYKFGKY